MTKRERLHAVWILTLRYWRNLVNKQSEMLQLKEPHPKTIGRSRIPHDRRIGVMPYVKKFHVPYNCWEFK